MTQYYIIHTNVFFILNEYRMCDLLSRLRMNSKNLNVNQVTQLLSVFCEIYKNLDIFAEL